ncbi:heavy metal-associated domain-containing protein [Candidatus Albibeggiatoa sp. nov. NOAA]|uniref:heavy-metal-associated domain-containing protein n=1 Tax=Candidatus Albibeggiatoa sp. nov. NOAA TaxID=3162724 RepID=UPI0032F296F6|nr:heavy-metal-associated domain-containing protein [Thiotrichaceae bacterium]
MSEQIQVENIKCGGCANSIQKGLLKIEGVDAVEVDIEQGAVSIDGSADRDTLIQSLLSMGYPEKGSVEGLSSLKAKATSFVSCAVGRIDK